MEKKSDKKIKNIISVAILLGGLFVGSLFVDLGQVIRGSGFSAKNLNKSEIFEANGKTWVAYTEPAIAVKVISDDTCDKCDPSEALVWLRRVLPTIGVQQVAYDSEEGKQLISQFDISTLPAFVFDKDVDKTDFFSQAQILFDSKADQYILKTQELGLTPGKYLNAPDTTADDATVGNSDSKVKVVVFSDFQCPFCKSFWNTLRDTINQYGDRATFVYKHFPLGIHAQANDAALASSCAQEQNKFWEYGDALYAGQKDWSGANDIQKFKEYARNLKLDTVKFNQCLDSKKYQSKLDADVKEATDLGLSGTPATFVGSQFINGVSGTDDLRAAIDGELSK